MLLHCSVGWLSQGKVLLTFVVAAVVIDPFPGMGAWRKTMEPQKQGNSSRPGPEIVKRKRESPLPKGKGTEPSVQSTRS